MSWDDQPVAPVTISTPVEAAVSAAVAEGQRIMSICNACRYCEGYCAVFPAMERRLEFTGSDLNYLANLCHNCGACYTSCQYAPPHEFALNLPRNFAEIRVETYGKFAWPAVFARLYRNGVGAASLLTGALVAIFVLGVLLRNPEAFAASRASFYDVIPHYVMAGVFGAVGLFIVATLGAMFIRFWRNSGQSLGAMFDVRAIGHAAADALLLTHLRGGGEGCAGATERPSTLRRWFHHLTSYGFALCFAATVVATWYHYGLGERAPYPVTSLPVVLGVVGGIGLLIGPAGLWWLGRRRDPVLDDPRQAGMNASFIALLFLTSLTGLLLLALRETAAVGVLLAVHLGVVMALFVTLPYGKFIHVIHRCAALLRYALERRRPLPNVGAD